MPRREKEPKANVCGSDLSGAQDVSPEMDRFHTDDCGNMDNEPSPSSLGDQNAGLEGKEYTEDK